MYVLVGTYVNTYVYTYTYDAHVHTHTHTHTHTASIHTCIRIYTQIAHTFTARNLSDIIWATAKLGLRKEDHFLRVFESRALRVAKTFEARDREYPCNTTDDC
jgi:hypothetical protein